MKSLEAANCLDSPEIQPTQPCIFTARRPSCELDAENLNCDGLRLVRSPYRVRKIALRGAITEHGVSAILRTLSASRIDSLPEAILDFGKFGSGIRQNRQIRAAFV
jgi:hypothetical protein